MRGARRRRHCFSCFRFVVCPRAAPSQAKLVAERPSRADSAMVKRFNEILLDFKTTFRKQQVRRPRAARAREHERLRAAVAATVSARPLSPQAAARQRREKAALFREAGAGGSTAGAETLLRERGSLLSSTRAMDEILAQAAQTSEALARQRGALGASAADVGDLASRLPLVGGFIEGLRGHRAFSDRVVALTIAAVLCFFLWLFVLRHF